MQREKVEISPLNVPSGDRYSFEAGFQLVNFQISNQPKLLDGRSLRLNGILRLQNKDGVLVNNNTNVASRAGINACLSNRVGVASVIDQITISTGSMQTLESIRSYGKYLAAVQPVTHSAMDFDTNLSHESLTSSRKLNAGLLVNNEVSFSIPLRTGLLSGGTPIPLSVNGLSGMNLELRLSPSSNVFSGNRVGTDSDVGFTYELKNLSLSYDLIVPSLEDQGKLSIPNTGRFAYNSLQHIYSVINSSDTTLQLNLNSGKTTISKRMALQRRNF